MHKAKIRLGSNNYLVIDLTEPLSERTEVYPGDPRPTKEVLSEIVTTGCQHYVYTLSNHNFHPHADAPRHQNIELQHKGIESFSIDYFFNHAFMVDLSKSSSSKKFQGIEYLVEVSKSHLIPFSKLLKEKSAIVIRTGYDKWLENNLPHNPETIPYLDEEAASFIASFQNIKVVGIDSLTVDKPGTNSSHKSLKDKLIIESLVHLYDIPESSRKSFDLETTPIKIIGSTGSPVIAYAFIELT